MLASLTTTLFHRVLWWEHRVLRAWGYAVMRTLSTMNMSCYKWVAFWRELFRTRSRALTITILQFRIWAHLVVPAYREGGVSEQFLRVQPMPAKTIKSGQDHMSQRKILVSSQQPVKPCFALTRSFRRKSCLDLQTWFGRSSPGNGDSCRKPNFFPKFRKKLSWSGIREKFSECEIHLFRLISSFSLAGVDVTRLFWKGMGLRRALWNLTLNSKLFILWWKN